MAVPHLTGIEVLLEEPEGTEPEDCEEQRGSSSEAG